MDPLKPRRGRASYSSSASMSVTSTPGLGGFGGPAGASHPAELLNEHLGEEAWLLPVLSGSWPPYEHVNLQGAVDRWLAARGGEQRLVGLIGFRHRMFGLADLCQPGGEQGMAIGGVAMTDQPAGPGDEVRSCVQCGLYLIDGGSGDAGDDAAAKDPAPMAILLRGSDTRGPQPDATLEIACADRAAAREALAEIRRLAIEHSIYRGQVLTFQGRTFGPPGQLIDFHERPEMTREELILPPGMLEGIETQILAVARHRKALLAHGQHLKRGVLLYGAPGTGKTHTVRYLMSRLPQTTVLILSGTALGMIGRACEIARALEPALIVVEDVDLIAQDRSMGPGTNPMLFELLNEMDGLDGDADVTFVLTTNRVDVLEPALAMRPGRVDHAVEVPIPDADGRRRLLALYRGGLDLDLDDADEVVERTAGVTASFLKELIRRAALIAADETAGIRATVPEGVALRVEGRHLAQAMDVLSDSRHELTRRLLGGAGDVTNDGLDAVPLGASSADGHRG
jgi:cell division protease FtsH